MIQRVRQQSLCGILMLGCCLGSVSAMAAPENTEKIPVERIVLFNSGVGFFEHRGFVEGDDQVELRFKTNDINDLLKSLVLQDLGGGRISTVSYGSRDPITKTLQTFAIDLTNNPTLFDLLSQVRGRELIVQAPREIRGIMVGAERRPQAVPGGEPIKADYINLLTDEGLQSIALQAVSRIQMADPELEKEFRSALQTLASANTTDKKTVSLEFLGEGRRPVRVGYVREAPVWKTSYRLVLRDEEAPLLQGWAIVENTGDQDWKDVELSLVSGRPISFMMDLYSPLYASRPTVAHELYASLQPQQYDQAMEVEMTEEKMAERRASVAARRSRMLSKSVRGMDARNRGGGGGGAFGGGGRGGGGGQGGAGGGIDDPFGDPEADDDGVFDISQGVAAVAEASQVGELFRYDIELPVSIERQRSAMLPIINNSVEASKVSIYDLAVHAKHPLNGVRLKNTSDLHLMGGPITLFDGGVYAGDGKVTALPPGEERLVSYAMDLDVEVAPSVEGKPQRLVSVKLVKGMMHATYQQAQTVTYSIKNSSDQEKTVLIERPIQANWKLVEPTEADETTRDRHRFNVQAPVGETTKLVVKQRRDVLQVASLGSVGNQQFKLFIAAEAISDAVKAALAEIQKRQAEIAKVVHDKQSLQKELSVIVSEQDRIRKNMQQLPHDSELYKRYIKKFSEQEDRVEQLRKDVKEFNAKESKLRQSLSDYLMALKVD